MYALGRGWVDAGALMLGDRLIEADGELGVVQALSVAGERAVVYNLTVTDAHTYFVGSGQWWVHNCTRYGGGQPSAQGAQVTEHARSIHEPMNWWERRSTNVAVGMDTSGNLFVTVNGGAARSGIPHVMQAAEDLGATFIPNGRGGAPEFHAERFLYNSVPNISVVGISVRGGPCSTCSRFFERILSVELDY